MSLGLAGQVVADEHINHLPEENGRGRNKQGVGQLVQRLAADRQRVPPQVEKPEEEEAGQHKAGSKAQCWLENMIARLLDIAVSGPAILQGNSRLFVPAGPAYRKKQYVQQPVENQKDGDNKQTDNKGDRKFRTRDHQSDNPENPQQQQVAKGHDMPTRSKLFPEAMCILQLSGIANETGYSLPVAPDHDGDQQAEKAAKG